MITSYTETLIRRDLSLDLPSPFESFYSLVSFALESLSALAIHEPVSKRKLTPLHIAVIFENLKAVKRLVKEGANVDALDSKGLSPLDHAILAGNRVIGKFLQKQGSHATIDTIVALNERTLPHLFFERDGARLPLSSLQFKEMTSARYLFNHHASLEQLGLLWTSEEKNDPSVSFVKQVRAQYPRFLENRPSLVIKEVEKAGLGLFAGQLIKKGAIVGEFLGDLSDEGTFNDYVLGPYNGLLARNETACINDGFINVVLVEIKIDLLPARFVFVATENIEEGEQICWNYGPYHSVARYEDYVPLRYAELCQFLKTVSFEKAIETSKKALKPKKMTFDDFIVFEQLRYLINRPQVVRILVSENVLFPDQVKELIIAAYSVYKASSEERMALQNALR